MGTTEAKSGQAPMARRFRQGIVVVVLAVLSLVLLAATSSTNAANVPPGPSDLPTSPIFSSTVQSPPPAFYRPPSPLPDVLPGTILKSEPISDAPRGVAATRIMYMSRSANGEPVAVTGLIAQPATAAPPGGRPVVAFAHGTTGIGRECGISQDPFTPGTAGASMWDPRMRPLVDSGYVVAATDYEGEGAPGKPTYLVESIEGQNVLDSLRAAIYLEPEAVDPSNLAIYGHSQGGHAALSAASLAPSYAPELQVRGVVGAAPGLLPSLPLVVSQLVNQSGTPDEAAARAAYLMNIIKSWTVLYPDDIRPSDYLTSEGIELLPDTLKYCYGNLSSKLRGRFDKIVKAAPANSMLKVTSENMPVDRKIEAPVLLLQGLKDTDVVPQLTIAAANSLCQLGSDVELRTFANDTHETLLWSARPTLLDWLSDRFERLPTSSTCGGLR
ncbi:MAG: alpha/beta fold hydrolase [Candidatus Nanopelagicales bacterium]|nr:alpha/beta fold hydrolase [Candidatus Nanopelagicales bacterium]